MHHQSTGSSKHQTINHQPSNIANVDVGLTMELWSFYALSFLISQFVRTNSFMSSSSSRSSSSSSSSSSASRLGSVASHQSASISDQSANSGSSSTCSGSSQNSPWTYSPNSSFSTVESSEIQSTCACGELQVRVPVESLHKDTPAIDCLCRSCRKFHSAASTSFLLADVDKVQIIGETAQTYQDLCFELGIVERIFCKSCFSKVATRTKAGNVHRDQILVNMGAIKDETIPTNMLQSLRHDRKIWQEDQKAGWMEALPLASETDEEPPSGRWTGGCSCGASRFYVDYAPPTELQHCYCQLCRQLSGGSFATWIPFPNESISWNTEPPLVRTTRFGQRHICTSCGSILSIVYDEQPGCTWPSMASFDAPTPAIDVSTTLPATTAAMNHHLYRVCHICTDFLQRWYKIPDDGLERVREAC